MKKKKRFIGIVTCVLLIMGLQNNFLSIVAADMPSERTYVASEESIDKDNEGEDEEEEEEQVKLVETGKTVTVPYWHKKGGYIYQSLKGNAIKQQHANYRYQFEMEYAGILSCKLLSDVDGGLIAYIKNKNGTEIETIESQTEQDSQYSDYEDEPIVYLKAGTYIVDVEYNDEGYEDYTDENDGEAEETSAIDYELRFSAVKEDTDCSWDMKKTERCYGKKGKAYYKKIKLTKDGILKVYSYKVMKEDFWNYANGWDYTASTAEVSICDKNKKKQSGEYNWLRSVTDPACFVLKKGTYYLRIEGDDGLYQLWTKFIPMSAGSETKKNAVSLTSKYKHCIIPAFREKSKISKWFKFEIKKPKKKNIDIIFTGVSGGTLTDFGKLSIDIYKNNKKVGSGWIVNPKGDAMSLSISTTSTVAGTDKKMPWSKGTYYIRVRNNKKNIHGWLSMRMK